MAFPAASRLIRTPWGLRGEAQVDWSIALVVFVLSLALLAAEGASRPDSRDPDALAVVLVAFASLPLAARRKAPLAVFVVTAVSSAVLNLVGYPGGPPLGPTVAVYFLALSSQVMRVPRWLAAAVVAALLLVHAGAVGVADESFPTVPLLFGALVWGGAWVVGDRVRMRRQRIEELEERARRAEREAERERRLAAAEERTRIARDLHDSAGHAINVILVQAGAARLLGEHDPGRSQALRTIEDVARETLGEIDQLVRALRDDELPAESRRNVEPPVGLSGLDTLADRHRSAGLEVDVRLRGSRRPLPPGVDQAAYRIVQEALTNAARYGSGSAAVEIAYGARELELGVSNPTARRERPEADGHGIIGMRERAGLLGGRLDVRTENGVFRIRARLPYGGEER